ncbi:MAG: hypothetical protein U9M90_03410 [Patescibacteria group bacterium]|nr:hypothetical protein [Patescibacteria group bacterium]
MSGMLKKNWHIWILAAIMLVAFFVRIWNLNDMLCFKMDQARDAAIIQNTFEQGPGYLPLLGPRSAGTFLRLGPVFYYFQYISTQITQSIEPVVLVYPDILFSVLAIPLFFVFLSQFFTRGTSVILSGLFGLSFIAVQYGRFAWNPNQTVFWSILFLLCVYKTAIFKNRRKAGWWLIGAAASYGVLSQLHFTALLIFPIVTLLFWMFYRPSRIKLAFWIGAFAVLTVFYIPMMLSETITGFDNMNQFKYALTHKSKELPLSEKINQSLKLHGKYYSLFLTSYGNTENRCFVYTFYAMILFALWRGHRLWKETQSKEKRAFLVLIACWFFVFSLLYTKLAFTVLKTRFWLLIIAIPYIILGLFFEWIYRVGHKKRGYIIAGIITMFLFVGNTHAIGYWYWAIINQREATEHPRNLVLKQSNLVSIKQMADAVDFIADRSNEAGKQVCYNTEGEYKSPYMYLFKLHYPLMPVKRVTFAKDTNEACVFFSIENGGVGEEPELPNSYKKYFYSIQKKQFGVVTVWEIWKDEEGVNKYVELRKQQKALKKINESKEENLKEDNEDKKPRRKERVFWKDVLSGDYEE